MLKRFLLEIPKKILKYRAFQLQLVVINIEPLDTRMTVIMECLPAENQLCHRFLIKAKRTGNKLMKVPISFIK